MVSSAGLLRFRKPESNLGRRRRRCSAQCAELIASGKDGIYELMLSNAAYMSQWKNNAEISLPFTTAEFDAMLSERAKKSKYINTKSDVAPTGIYSDR